MQVDPLRDPSRWPAIAALSTITLALLVLLGWIAGFDPLKSVLPGFATMKPPTAANFLLCALSLWAWLRRPQHPAAAHLFRPPLLAVALLAAASLCADLGLLTIAASEGLRSSSYTSVTFLLLAAGLWLLDAPPLLASPPAQWFGLAVCSLAYASMLITLWGTTLSGHPLSHSTVALHTLAGFILLGTGLLFARSRHGFMSVLLSDRSGSIFLRRCLPALLFFAPAATWAALTLETTGILERRVASAGLIGFFLLALAAIMFFTARALNQREHDRDLFHRRSLARTAISAELRSAPNSTTAASRLLSVTLREFGWTMGAFWAPAPWSDRLRCFASVELGADGESLGPNELTGAELEPGQGIAGRVWASGEGVLISDFAHEPGLPPIKLKVQSRFRWLIAVPVMRAQKIAGVLEFFGPNPIDADHYIVHLLTAIGEQLGTFLDRLEAEETIAEHRKQHQQLEKLEAVGRLAGSVAGDFSQLITNILDSTGDLDRQASAGSRPIQGLAELRASAAKAADLTGQLLAFSQKHSPAPAPIDVNQSIRDSVPVIKRLLGESIRLELALHAENAFVLAGPTQIDQLLMNLTLHSRDYLPDSGIIQIRTSIRPNPSHLPGSHSSLSVEISFADHSNGGLHHIPQIHTNGLPGDALLDAVRAIAHQLGGSMQWNGAPGDASALSVLLPLAAAPPSAPTAPLTPAAPAVQPATILLVEDQSIVRLLTQEVLEEAGYSVLSAGDGQEALDKAGAYSGEIHLVVTDVSMPRLTGHEMFHQLNATRPGIQVLYLSGHSPAELRTMGLNTEQHLVLRKPFLPEDVLQNVNQLLAKGVPN